MTTKNTISIVVVIAIAVMFVSSSTFVNPLLAKTHKDKTSETDKSSTQAVNQSNKKGPRNTDSGSSNSDPSTGSGSSGSSNSDPSTGSGSSGSSNSDPSTGSTKTTDNSSPSMDPQTNYDKFQKCLFDADNSKGFATKQEIKDCFTPIFNTPTAAMAKDFSRPNLDSTSSSGNL